MRYKKILVLACCLTLGVGTALTGCAGSSTDAAATTDENTTAGTSDNSMAAEETTEAPESEAAQQDGIYGQISAISGNEITIALAENNMPTGEAPTGDAPTGEAPTGDAPSGEAPAGDASTGDAPSGDAPTGEAPSGDSTEMMTGENGEAPGLNLTGEEKTITISDSTTITIVDKDSSTDGSIEDLAEGDMITVKMDGDTVVSIEVRGGMPDGAAPTDGTAPEKSTTEATAQ